MRRLLVGVLCAAVAVTIVPSAPVNIGSGNEGVEILRRGNEAYLAGRVSATGWTVERRTEVALGQHPFAAILTCADSRVPPEVIFGQGLGDLFVVRVAGAVADKAVLGSIEYAVEHLHTPLVVVMGHTACGAVKAAMTSAPPNKPDPAGVNLEHILAAIRPSLPHFQTGEDPWTSAVYSSVEQNIKDVMRLSPVLAEFSGQGKISIVGAVYALNTGKVHFSRPVAVPAGEHKPAPVTHSAVEPAGHAQVPAAREHR